MVVLCLALIALSFFALGLRVGQHRRGQSERERMLEKQVVSWVAEVATQRIHARQLEDRLREMEAGKWFSVEDLWDVR